MNGISLFSGAGIGELALKQTIPNYRTIAYVEWDTYCQEVIRARIRDGILDDAPIFNDIRVFNKRFASFYAGKVDWISGGFPCQPFSTAGNQLGEADERNMWPETRDAISIIRLSYAFLENVRGLLGLSYIRQIFGDLAFIGYNCEWDLVRASHVGALHRRERWWCLAYANNFYGQFCKDDKDRKEVKQKSWTSEFRRSSVLETSSSKGEFNWTVSESELGRMVNGLANAMDRLKAIGNGWVPQVASRILDVQTNT